MDRVEKIIGVIFCVFIGSGLIIGTCLLFVNNGKYYIEGAELLAAVACGLAITISCMLLNRFCLKE